MKRGILLLLVLLTTSISAFSMEHATHADSTHVPDSTRSTTYSWINLGMGTSLEYPLAFTIGLNYQLKKYLVSARFLITDELDLQNQSSSESIWDVGLLLGRFYKSDHILASLSAGLSLVGGMKRGSFISNDETWGGYYELKHRAILGIPLESHLIYLLSQNAGIGITAFGNLNLDKPFFGALISLQLGIIR